MRDLIDFLYRFNAFFFFIIFEALCFFLISRNNTYHRASILNSSNTVVGSVYGFTNSMTNYFQLSNVNDSLIAENRRLKQMLHNSPELFQPESAMLLDSCDESNNKFAFYDVFVINNSTNSLYNNITINKGSNHGLTEEMGLVSAEGVVGIIKSVSPRYAMAMSLLHKNAKLSGKIKKNDYTGTIIWNGLNPRLVQLQDIPKHVSLSKNDTVITSGYSAIFPADVLIGTIEDFDLKTGSNFYNINVKLATDFQRLSYVYAIDNRDKAEQLELELNNKDE